MVINCLQKSNIPSWIARSISVCALLKRISTLNLLEKTPVRKYTRLHCRIFFIIIRKEDMMKFLIVSWCSNYAGWISISLNQRSSWSLLEVIVVQRCIFWINEALVYHSNHHLLLFTAFTNCNANLFGFSNFAIVNLSCSSGNASPNCLESVKG